MHNAGYFRTCCNAFNKSVDEIASGKEIASLLPDLLETKGELEPWLPRLQERVQEIMNEPKPKGNMELGLFDWAKNAILAQFIWIEIADNAYTLWLKAIAGGKPVDKMKSLFEEYVNANFEMTQTLPRTLDFIKTKKEWPPSKWIDTKSLAPNYILGQILSKKIEAEFSDIAAADITYPANGKCEIGNKGPGGGIVFYVAPTPQSWGQYLEVAPATWNGTSTDPEALWCDVRDVFLVSAAGDPELKKLIGYEIGKGRSNTQLMSAYCKSGAANLASAYRGGGKSDWFLPSKDELNQMYVNKTTIGDFATDYYWSSSVYNAPYAWFQNFGTGIQNLNLKNLAHSVRPVRSFS